MKSISISSFHHLSWNPDKGSFEILSSTEQKIVSFLYNSVMKTWCLYPGQSLSPDSWSEKGFSYFKQKHIIECPVEEFKETLISFYDDLWQQICDHGINNAVSKEIALSSLQKITTNCFWKLFGKPSLNMPQLHFHNLPETNKQYINALCKGQCYHYAFYLRREYKVMESMIPFESSCNAAFLLYPKYFIRQLGYIETRNPAKGDLVLYLGDPKCDNNARFKHLGVMSEGKTIKSRWGNFSFQFEHQIFQVPEQYGSEVIFFHRVFLIPEDFNKILKATNQMSNLILQFNSQTVPSTPSISESLLFLLDQLRSACQKSNQASEKWDWVKIEENLLATLNFPNLKRTELVKEFQSWMQEILPQHFLKETTMPDLIDQFNSSYIPYPLSNLGALLLLFNQLKSTCQKSNQDSKMWDWVKIEENLFATINHSTAKRAELRKEFQLWMQEILP